MNKLIEILRKALVAELVFQKHKARGTLINSIQVVSKKVTDGWDIEATGEDYGKYVNTGRRAGKFAPIDAIKEWCRVVGIPQEAAWAINMTIKRDGIPTPGGKRISSRRTGFVEQALKDSETQVMKEIEDYKYADLNTKIENLVAKWQSQ